MNAKKQRKPFGERLIASMSGGLQALREDKPLLQWLVPARPKRTSQSKAQKSEQGD